MKKLIFSLTMLIAITGLLVTGCSNKKEEASSESTETSEVESDEPSESVEASDEESDSLSAGNDASLAGEDTSGDDTNITQEVSIDGKSYLEVYFTDDAESTSYYFDDYVVTVADDSWEEVGTDLTEDGDKAEFYVMISSQKVIKTTPVTIDCAYLEKNGKQLGNTDFESGEIAKNYRTGDNITLKFGRAYYDYDNTLYVDVLIVEAKKFFSSTISIKLQETEEASAAEPQEVEIEGETYLEIMYIEDEEDTYYKVGDYAVMMVDSWEEVGSDLVAVEGENKAEFMVGIAGPSKIETKKITIDYDEMENNPKQFGYTSYEDGEFSNNFRKGDTGTVSFGKAYYDDNGMLLVDVLITKDHKIYTGTIEIEIQ